MEKRKNKSFGLSEFLKILIINFLLIAISVLYFYFENEINSKNVFRYLSNNDKGYWKESFCFLDNYSKLDSLYFIELKKEDDFLYIHKDSIINFEKSVSNKNLTYTRTHTEEIQRLKEIDRNNFLGMYSKRDFDKKLFIFKKVDDNKFQIIFKEDNKILHEFVRIKEIPKIDTLLSNQLYKTYLENKNRQYRTCGMSYNFERQKEEKQDSR